ncbi:MAG TPA: DUF1232 domain-containing protein [Candidatus Limnocylindria bacterium]|nr:DUF1232 domain-containing protein [Candidatus Limnocylindria bacterium]
MTKIPESYVTAAAEPGAPTKIAEHLPAKLARIGDRSLVRLARDAYRYATDPRVPQAYKLMGLAALFYLLNPFDLIPDFIPGTGYLDDIGALTAFVVAVRKMIETARDAAKEVVSHAVAETEAAVARRGLAQVSLSIWASTLVACVGLVYYVTRTALAPGSTALADPFFVACSLTAAIGTVASARFAERVWRTWQRAPAWVQERLWWALAAQAQGRELLLLAAPIVLLILILLVRIAA